MRPFHSWSDNGIKGIRSLTRVHYGLSCWRERFPRLSPDVRSQTRNNTTMRLKQERLGPWDLVELKEDSSWSRTTGHLVPSGSLKIVVGTPARSLEIFRIDGMSRDISDATMGRPGEKGRIEGSDDLAAGFPFSSSIAFRHIARRMMALDALARPDKPCLPVYVALGKASDVERRGLCCAAPLLLHHCPRKNYVMFAGSSWSSLRRRQCDCSHPGKASSLSAGRRCAGVQAISLVSEGNTALLATSQPQTIPYWAEGREGRKVTTSISVSAMRSVGLKFPKAVKLCHEKKSYCRKDIV
ncbi:hypothetical protein GE09DRAFT_116312 [Coniochaeta sp. 2T2.1]|nr:hypothetical protein GE09DRAFT_116312 [Coniochaeta sp. 2T2.1]